MTLRFKIIGAVISVIFLIPSLLDSQTVNPVSVPFGGPIIFAQPCTCSSNWRIIVFDYRTMSAIPISVNPPFSRLYQLYNFFIPGPQTLGTYSSGGICLITVTGGDCEPLVVIGTINNSPGAGSSGI